MIEQPQNDREQEPREPVSLLYPENEHPSEKAREVARSPEFREAIENRVNEALYANRALPSILFPKFPGRMGSEIFTALKKNVPEKVASKLPDVVPTFDHSINADTFAYEEAIEIDRYARGELFERGIQSPSDQNVADEIDRLLEDGTLRPAEQIQIEREEKWRRPLIAFAESLKRGSFTEAEALAPVLSKAAQGDDSKMVADYFRTIIVPLLDSAYNQLSVDEKYPDVLELLHLASLCTFIPKEQYALQAQLILKHPEARKALGAGFLRIIEDPRYESLFAMWKEYSIPEWTIIQSIHARVDDFIESRLVKNNRVDIDEAEKALTILKERGILSEEEARVKHLDAFRALGKNEIEKAVEYWKMLDKEIQS
ncbi:MAG: hypothetical protein AAB855_00805, partial [Patescibacteria group bacterium]